MESDAKRGGFISGFDLKLIAIVAMIIDHVGAIFFPSNIYLRVIGRLTMPIMSFFIAEGYRHTSDVSRYIGRMVVFAFVSQVPFMLLFNYTPSNMPLNVMFTFVLGLLALLAIDRLPNVWSKICAVAAIVYAGYVLNVDYHDIGVLMVLSFGIARGKKARMVLSFCAFVVVFVFAPAAYSMLDLLARIAGVNPLNPATYPALIAQTRDMLATNLSMFGWRFVQAACILAAPLLALYNGKRGRGMKYLFYVFYPAHMLLLYVIKMLLGTF